MAIDIKKLREMQKNLNKKAGSGDDLYLYSSALKEEQDIRILPASPKMNGVYFAEQEVWWVNGKMYQSNSTFGGDDVIDEEIEEARAEGDKDILALIEKKGAKGMPIVKKETRYLVPVLLLDCKYNDDDELVSVDVVGDEPKVLVAKPTLIKDINKVFTARPYQNGTQDGMADRVKGFNMIVGKTGSGKQTEYFAMGWNEAMEMEEKYYKKIPDVMELRDKMKKSDDYLRSVIRNYLYGEEIIEDENTQEDEDKPKKQSPKPSSARPTREAVKSAPKSREDDDEDFEEEQPKKTPAKKSAGSKASRSLIDDAEAELDDLD